LGWRQNTDGLSHVNGDIHSTSLGYTAIEKLKAWHPNVRKKTLTGDPTTKYIAV
jgi:hypothetical protein